MNQEVKQEMTITCGKNPFSDSIDNFHVSMLKGLCIRQMVCKSIVLSEISVTVWNEKVIYNGWL